MMGDIYRQQQSNYDERKTTHFAEFKAPSLLIPQQKNAYR
jgi:hypothetical protein